jgi:hypothetical protein
MNAEILTKVAKAAIPLLALVGIKMDPAQLDTIINAGVILYSAVSGLEAWLKKKGADK